MFAFSESAKIIARAYGIKLFTVENIQQRPIDKIYIYEPEQLVEVSKLYFQLKVLYGFDKIRKNNIHPMNDPEYHVYYLDKNNQNIEDGISILSGSGFPYISYEGFDNLHYQNEETFLRHLTAWWNEAKRNGKVPVWTSDRY